MRWDALDIVEMKTVFLIILAVIIIGILALVIGPCVYFNVFDGGGGPDMPEAAEAAYSFRIDNTGGEVLATDFEQVGQVKGERVFILHGFWELKKKDFIFIDHELTLDEKIFGEITLRKRTVGN